MSQHPPTTHWRSCQSRAAGQHRRRGMSVHAEAGLAGRVLLDHLDVGDVGPPRALAAPGDHALTGRAPAVDVEKISLWLQVPDLAHAHTALLAAGVDVVDPPERKPWGLDEMWIRDPDGVSIVVVQVPDDHPLRRRD